jgi:hypothetical protein
MLRTTSLLAAVLALTGVERGAGLAVGTARAGMPVLRAHAVSPPRVALMAGKRKKGGGKKRKKPDGVKAGGSAPSAGAPEVPATPTPLIIQSDASPAPPPPAAAPPPAAMPAAMPLDASMPLDAAPLPPRSARPEAEEALELPEITTELPFGDEPRVQLPSFEDYLKGPAKPRPPPGAQFERNRPYESKLAPINPGNPRFATEKEETPLMEKIVFRTTIGGIALLIFIEIFINTPLFQSVKPALNALADFVSGA